MTYIIIAAGLCFVCAAILFFCIPEHGGDGYIGQGLMAMFSLIASFALLALAVIVWLYKHLSFV